MKINYKNNQIRELSVCPSSPFFFVSEGPMNPNKLGAVVERAVVDNWLAYKLWPRTTRRRDLTAAIVFAHPTFDYEATFKRVVAETADFPRAHSKGDAEVEAILQERRSIRGKKKKEGQEEIAFKLNGREFQNQEISNWLQEHQKTSPSKAKEESTVIALVCCFFFFFFSFVNAL